MFKTNNNFSRFEIKNKAFDWKKMLIWGAGFLIICFTMMWIMPFIIMLLSSFKTYGEVLDQTKPVWSLPNEWQTSNYDEAMGALELANSLWTSLYVTVGSNVVIILFSSLAAWQLVRRKTWYSQAIFYVLLVTMIIPFQAIMLPLITNINSWGMTNATGLIFVYAGFGVAQSTFMMHGFLKTVPISLEEVSKVEGYNPIIVYFKVILPLLKPIVVTMVLLNTMWVWNDYLLPSLVNIFNIDFLTLPVVLNKNLVGTFGTQTHILMAGVTILVIPAITFFVVMQKQIIGGVTNGAVK